METESKIAETTKLEWQAITLRVTSFFNPVINISENQWWEDVTGRSPEVDQRNPKEFRRETVGDWKGRKLALLLQPDRCDWVLTSDNQEWAQIGEFQEAAESLFDLISEWLSRRPDVVRLAFGAIVSIGVENVQAGYHKIGLLVPGLRFDENCSDFLYQMNRRRPLGTEVPNLKLNRLGRWSVAGKRAVHMTFGPEGSSVEAESPPEFNCQLLLDVNTLPTPEMALNGLPQERLVTLLRELVDLGYEISEKGDIRMTQLFCNETLTSDVPYAEAGGGLTADFEMDPITLAQGELQGGTRHVLVIPAHRGTEENRFQLQIGGVYQNSHYVPQSSRSSYSGWNMGFGLGSTTEIDSRFQVLADTRQKAVAAAQKLSNLPHSNVRRRFPGDNVMMTLHQSIKRIKSKHLESELSALKAEPEIDSEGYRLRPTERAVLVSTRLVQILVEDDFLRFPLPVLSVDGQGGIRFEWEAHTTPCADCYSG